MDHIDPWGGRIGAPFMPAGPWSTPILSRAFLFPSRNPNDQRLAIVVLTIATSIVQVRGEVCALCITDARRPLEIVHTLPLGQGGGRSDGEVIMTNKTNSPPPPPVRAAASAAATCHGWPT